MARRNWSQMRAMGISEISSCSSRSRCRSRSSGPEKASSWTTKPLPAPRAVVGASEAVILAQAHERDHLVRGNDTVEHAPHGVGRSQQKGHQGLEQEHEDEQRKIA